MLVKVDEVVVPGFGQPVGDRDELALSDVANVSDVLDDVSVFDGDQRQVAVGGCHFFVAGGNHGLRDKVLGVHNQASPRARCHWALQSGHSAAHHDALDGNLQVVEHHPPGPLEGRVESVEAEVLARGVLLDNSGAHQVVRGGVGVVVVEASLSCHCCVGRAAKKYLGVGTRQSALPLDESGGGLQIGGEVTVVVLPEPGAVVEKSIDSGVTPARQYVSAAGYAQWLACQSEVGHRVESLEGAVVVDKLVAQEVGARVDAQGFEVEDGRKDRGHPVLPDDVARFHHQVFQRVGSHDLHRHGTEQAFTPGDVDVAHLLLFHSTGRIRHGDSVEEVNLVGLSNRRKTPIDGPTVDDPLGRPRLQSVQSDVLFRQSVDTGCHRGCLDL